MTALRHGADEPTTFVNVCSSTKSGNDVGRSTRSALPEASLGSQWHLITNRGCDGLGAYAFGVPARLYLLARPFASSRPKVRASEKVHCYD
jgi:hypothetical protein